MRHLGQRHDLLDRLDHAESGPQDGHEQDDLGDVAHRHGAATGVSTATRPVPRSRNAS